MLNYVLEKEIILEEVLPKKSKLNFRINNGNMWYSTRVDNANKNEIILAFPEMFAATDLILGDTLFCKFTDEKNEYSFEGEIESIKIYFPQQIKIKVLSEIEHFENVRQSNRLEAIFLANVFVGDEIVHACVRDISSTGLRVISKNHIEEGQEVQVHISLPLRNVFDSIVKLKGRVMWSKIMYNRNEYGISIVDMEGIYRDRMEFFLDRYGK